MATFPIKSARMGMSTHGFKKGRGMAIQEKE